jgi:hypothetical protein
MVVHHVRQMAQTLSDSGSARHRGHRYISVDIQRGLEGWLENYNHVSKRVGAARCISLLIISTYGNDDLGNLNVEDHDLGGCTGISGRHS